MTTVNQQSRLALATCLEQSDQMAYATCIADAGQLQCFVNMKAIQIVMTNVICKG